MDAASLFQEAEKEIQEIQEKDIQEPKVLITPLTHLYKSAEIWPDLRPLIELIQTRHPLMIDQLWLASYEARKGPVQDFENLQRLQNYSDSYASSTPCGSFDKRMFGLTNTLH